MTYARSTSGSAAEFWRIMKSSNCRRVPNNRDGFTIPGCDKPACSDLHPAMQSHFFRALLTLGFVVALTGANTLAEANGPVPSLQRSTSARIETIQFRSALVGKTLPYNVILPADYRISARRYPVLYLLHGWAGHYDDWATRTNIADYAAQYRIIDVMRERNDGWYTDSATISGDKYESYILQELI